METHGRPVGPLHGVPISLKDVFRVKGAETSVGFVGLLGQIESDEMESEIVKMMREMGAVLHVKTNVPTSLMVGWGVCLDFCSGRQEHRSVVWLMR